MRPVTLRLSAAGFSPWIALNRLQWVTNASIAVSLSSGASLTYSVEHTFDDIHYLNQDISIARTTTTATVTETNHGLSVDSWIQVANAGDPLDGTFKVASVVDANNFTYTVANSGVAVSGPSATLQKARIFPHSVLAAKTVSSDSNYAFPAMAVRLNVTTYASGFADIVLLQGN